MMDLKLHADHVPMDENDVSPEGAVRLVEGTAVLVRRDDGERSVPVETLAAGDALVTAAGGTCRLRAVRRRVLNARDGDPRSVWPICVAKDAMGSGKPSADLHLSPDLVVSLRVVTDLLVPVAWLVNGSTIERVTTDSVAYVELVLESDDLILADGLPVRAEPGGARRTRPSATLSSDTLDLADEFDPALLEAVQDLLATRAASLGWSPTEGAAFFLLADDRLIHHHTIGRETFAAIPAGTRELRIFAQVFKPSWFNIPDTRRLGLAIFDLTLAGAHDGPRTVDLDAPGLAGLFHDGERRDGCAHRWTKGDLVLPLGDEHGCADALLLHLTFDAGGLRRWSRPAPPPAPNQP